MKLFHYTNIDSLALILRNKTIRFSRLDRVDDPDEYSFKEDGVTPAQYCYKFCNQHAIDFKEIGIYKSEDWAFQQECRFLFNVMPLLSNGLVNPTYIFQNNISPKVSCIDVPIKKEWLKKIKIQLGPKVTESEEIIVKSLMKEYLNRTDYEYSFYKNKL